MRAADYGYYPGRYSWIQFRHGERPFCIGRMQWSKEDGCWTNYPQEGDIIKVTSFRLYATKEFLSKKDSYIKIGNEYVMVNRFYSASLHPLIDVVEIENLSIKLTEVMDGYLWYEDDERTAKQPIVDIPEGSILTLYYENDTILRQRTDEFYKQVKAAEEKREKKERKN